MGTLLKTPKMNRALAARVEASVRRGSSQGAAVDRKWTVLFRFAILFGAIGSVISIFVMQKREDVRLEQTRAAILDTVRVERGHLRDTDMMNLERSTQTLVRAAGRYEGDLVTNEVRGAEALRSVLSRPLVYVRGPLDSFKNDEAIALAAHGSTLDAFVACLFDPPSSRAEKAMLERVRAPAAGSPRFRESTAEVRRLYYLTSGLPLLQSAWKARVKSAKNLGELQRFDKELRASHLDETSAAARARLLLVVMDERGGPGGVTELDGERPHDARVALVDLEANRTLLRLKRRLDPGGFSDRGRASHASGLDACALSLDVRDAAEKAALTGAAR
jgi:hypothetical protein